MTLFNCVSLLFIVSMGPPASGEVPDALVRAFRQRERFKTARFQYELRYTGGHLKGHGGRYESSVANEAVAWTRFSYSFRAGEADYSAGGYRQTIIDRGNQVRWRRGRKDRWVGRSDALETDERLPDPRSFGLSLCSFREKSPMELLDVMRTMPGTWRTSKEGRVVVVTHLFPFGDQEPHPETVWRIDPDKDNAVTDVSVFFVDASGQRERRSYVTTTYQRVDGHWWPLKIESNDLSGYEVEFGTVEFDRPEHPKELTPDIWQMPVGSQVISEDAHGVTDGHEVARRYLGSGKSASAEEWEAAQVATDRAAIDAFEQYSRGVRYRSDSGIPPGMDSEARRATPDPDEWEGYVRRWIIQHSTDASGSGDGTMKANALRPEQVTAAWGILKDSRRRAASILLRAKRDQATNTSGVKEVVGPPMPVEPTSRPASNNALGVIAKRSDRDARELDRIFDSLQRRLSGLLDRGQYLSVDAEARRDGDR